MMTRREFLNSLYRRLGNLSREQAEQHLTYYAEMLADRMEEGMSEEEAVASMEDVDTIAQRILQDEGVPPAYPDLFPTGGTESAEPAPPPVQRRRSWRKPAQIALWTLAILAVVFSVGQKLRGSLRTSTPVEMASDMTSNYDSGWLDVTSLEVDWRAGQVELQSWDGDTVQFQEEGDGSTLSQAFDGGGTLVLSGGSDGSRLKLLVPDNWELALSISGAADVWASDVELGRLTVDASSGNVTCSNLGVDELTVYTTSGDIALSDINAEDALSANSTSGDIVLSGVTGTGLDISTTSGSITNAGGATNWDVYTISGNISLYPSQSDCLSLATTSGQVHLEPARNTATVTIDTTSGDVELWAPDGDFYLSYDTSSGSLDRGGIPLTSDGGGEYWRGNGDGCSVSVYTTSGDLTLFEG